MSTNKYASVDFGTAEAVFNKLGGMEGIHRFLRGETELVVKVVSYRLEVFGQSIDDLVKLGNYTEVHPDINDRNFRADKMHQCEITLKHFNKSMSTDAVLKALDEEGWRPATMSELLEFGSRYLGLQKRFRIIALGSACHGMFGDSYVGYLHRRGGQRKLGLNLIAGNWGASHCFAAVRKSAA